MTVKGDVARKGSKTLETEADPARKGLALYRQGRSKRNKRESRESEVTEKVS